MLGRLPINNLRSRKPFNVGNDNDLSATCGNRPGANNIFRLPIATFHKHIWPNVVQQALGRVFFKQDHIVHRSQCCQYKRARMLPVDGA